MRNSEYLHLMHTLLLTNYEAALTIARSCPPEARLSVGGLTN
ncbi:hypothetical protein Pjdr2_6027 [Paenibacillus sp. JDR-2]|nr:hypothetical protein Pjdr2_6027 [Paenibacillus sp. JDR-2]